MPGDVGEPGLSTHGARVVVQQAVVVLDLEADLVLRWLGGDLRALGSGVRPEVGAVEQHPRDEREVVDTRHLAGAVEPVRRLGVRVVGTEPPGLGIHGGHRAGDALGSTADAGQHVGGVVAGVEHEPEPERADLVFAAEQQADGGATRLEVEVLLGDGDDLIRIQLGHQGGSEEELFQTGRGPALVRAARAHHGSRVEVRHDPRRRTEILRQRRLALGSRESLGTKALAADRGKAEIGLRDRRGHGGWLRCDLDDGAGNERWPSGRWRRVGGRWGEGRWGEGQGEAGEHGTEAMWRHSGEISQKAGK